MESGPISECGFVFVFALSVFPVGVTAFSQVLFLGPRPGSVEGQKKMSAHELFLCFRQLPLPEEKFGLTYELDLGLSQNLLETSSAAASSVAVFVFFSCCFSASFSACLSRFLAV